MNEIHRNYFQNGYRLSNQHIKHILGNILSTLKVSINLKIRVAEYYS